MYGMMSITTYIQDYFSLSSFFIPQYICLKGQRDIVLFMVGNVGR